MNPFWGILVSYLIGSIPTAYIFGRWLKGIDIRQHGSGNVGATNAFRVLGKAWGAVILILDILKGVVAVTLVGDILQMTSLGNRLVLALAVVCGHNWTVFLQFKGGKGIATSLGVLIGLSISFPSVGKVLLVCLLIWLAIFFISGYVSLSSILAGVALPFLMVLTQQAGEMIFLGVIFGIFVVVRHRPNIHRLLRGEESRVRMPFHKR